MSQGAWVLLVVLVLAGGFGLLRAATDGRFRGTHRVRGSAPAGRDDHSASAASAEAGPPPRGVLDGLAVGGDLGERATLLQFSSAFCAPCRAARRVLEDVARAVPGVTHLEVDAEHHLDLVRRVGVTRTPTTLVLDASGREVVRAAGVPRRDDVLKGLAQAVPDLPSRNTDMLSDE